MDKLYSFLIIATAIIILGAVMIFTVESGQPNSQINSWTDAIWWTTVTVTTVGYGDVVPVTDVGRIIAMFYMFFGITILGVALSIISTRYINKQRENEKKVTHGQQLILDKIEKLEENQEKLQKDLRELIDKQKEKQDD